MSKLYAVTRGSYSSYEIIALCSTREAAENIQKIYSNAYDAPNIEEYEDGASKDYEVWWEYNELQYGEPIYKELANGDLEFGKLEIEEYPPDDSRIKEYVGRYKKHPEYLKAEFKAKDRTHAEKKLYDMIAEFKAKEAGIT